MVSFALSAPPIRLGSGFSGYDFAVSILCAPVLRLLLQGLLRDLESQPLMMP